MSGKGDSMVIHMRATLHRAHCTLNQKFLTNHVGYGKGTLVQVLPYSRFLGTSTVSKSHLTKALHN